MPPRLSAGRAPGRTVSVLGLSSRVRAWSARRSNSCTPSTEAWVQTRIAKGQERRNVHWPLKGKQHSNDHSHSNYSRRHRCRQVRTRRLSRTGRPSVVFQFVSVDFTKLFHELVRSLFELVHYCRRELGPGKGPVEPYVSVKLATVTLSCSSELIHKIPRPCIGII